MSKFYRLASPDGKSYRYEIEDDNGRREISEAEWTFQKQKEMIQDTPVPAILTEEPNPIEPEDPEPSRIPAPRLVMPEIETQPRRSTTRKPRKKRPRKKTTRKRKKVTGGDKRD